MNRRNFILRVGGALVAVPMALQLTACGDDDGGGGGGAPDANTGGATSFMIGATGSGHSHQLTVQCSDLTSSGDVMYTSSVANGHSHVVTVTAAELGMINSGQAVTIDTSDSHPHSWAISKPTNACQ